MPLIVIRKLKSRGAYVDHKEYRRVMSNALRTEIAPILVKGHKAQVAHWKRNKPTFTGELSSTENSVVVSTSVGGPGADLWWAISGGVPGRTIRPTGRSGRGSGRALMMPTARTWGSRKKASRFRAYAVWPGITARQYTQRLRDQVTPEVRRLLSNALRRAVSAARKDMNV